MPYPYTRRRSQREHTIRECGSERSSGGWLYGNNMFLFTEGWHTVIRHFISLEQAFWATLPCTVLKTLFQLPPIRVLYIRLYGGRVQGGGETYSTKIYSNFHLSDYCTCPIMSTWMSTVFICSRHSPSADNLAPNIGLVLSWCLIQLYYANMLYYLL